MKKNLLAAGVALALAIPGAGVAGFIDFDGGAAVNGAVDVGSLDWAFTSFVAQGGNQAVANFIAGTGSTEFTVYTMASLTGYSDPDGNVKPDPTGLNSAFEITIILGFTENVTGFDATGAPSVSADFQSVTTGVSFLQMFYDTSVDSNVTTGFGFNDGRLILSGSGVTLSDASFTVDLSQVELLDQNGTDQYGGQLTVRGEGNTNNFSIDNLTWDSTFFKTALDTFGITFSNVSQDLPFVSTNPADCFTTATQGSTIGSVYANAGCTNLHDSTLMMSGQDVPGAPGYLPNIGSINGQAIGAGGGPDIVAQTDFNSPLTFRVPEPGTLAILGLGLAALGGTTRRRRKV